ncbi:MAG: flagellar basal body rod C-terminal domain-containing protein, partial [Clostridiaceae bacterium]
EGSNVDLAEQFTLMIESTRAYQANGKMISKSDEILQTLVNLT